MCSAPRPLQKDLQPVRRTSRARRTGIAFATRTLAVRVPRGKPLASTSGAGKNRALSWYRVCSGSQIGKAAWFRLRRMVRRTPVSGFPPPSGSPRPPAGGLNDQLPDSPMPPSQLISRDPELEGLSRRQGRYSRYYRVGFRGGANVGVMAKRTDCAGPR